MVGLHKCVRRLVRVGVSRLHVYRGRLPCNTLLNKHKRTLTTHPSSSCAYTLSTTTNQVFITVMDFVIYGMDPIQDSHAPFGMPGAAHAIIMVLGRYPGEGPGDENSMLLAFLKVLLWFTLLIFAVVIGRLVIHHMCLRDKCRINMFEGDQGTFAVMGMTAVAFLYAGSFVYNALVAVLGGPDVLAVTSSLDVQLRCELRGGYRVGCFEVGWGGGGGGPRFTSWSLGGGWCAMGYERQPRLLLRCLLRCLTTCVDGYSYRWVFMERGASRIAS